MNPHVKGVPLSVAEILSMCDDLLTFPPHSLSMEKYMCRCKFWLTIFFWLIPTGLLLAEQQQGNAGDYPINPVPPTSVQVDDGFWKQRIETNRKVTIPYDFQKCEGEDR